MADANIKKVYLIFKTHLDIGFTDYAEEIVKQYLTNFIPGAIKVGYELKDTDTPFIWTVGSWMVNEALKYDTDGTVEKAIKDGIISWHGLPFTTHTETMSPKLFEYGLSISKKLDERFGKTTISSKMTDVPGHTIGMVPLMAKAGIKFMHLGVNPATPLPDVPRLFKWVCDGSELIVMYQEDYGTDEIIGDTVLSFAHTHDNEGPQTADEIKAIYAEMQEKYPNAQITAGTLDDFANVVLANMGDIPQVDHEIGDVWIYGTGSDPRKVSAYRRVLRYIDQNGIGDVDLTDNLLLVPEHTWGMDTKIHIDNDDAHTFDELLHIADSRRHIEKAWLEQREYVKDAEELLGIGEEYTALYPDMRGWERTYETDCGLEIYWELFDRSDYERFMTTYMRLYVEWSMRDFLRKGLPAYTGGIFMPKVTEAYKKGDEKLYILKFNEDLEAKYGLPYFTVHKYGNNVDVKWFGKRVTKLPEAFWLKFKGMGENWQVNKMGQWINTDEIIGNPLLCAVYEGIRNDNVFIKSLDAMLVAPFGRRLLCHNIGKQMQDMHFLLYNNVYGTNFPLWYADDSCFRFVIEKA